MKKLLSFFQILCIDYSLVILINSISNLIIGYQSTDLWNVETFFFIAIVMLVWDLVLKINFKHNWTFYLTEGIVIYFMMLLFSYVLGWFSFESVTLIIVTIRYILLYTCITWILNIRYKIESDKINEMLSK